MLGLLASHCRHAVPACADAILAASGTVRQATRLLAAADTLYRYARRTPRTGSANAWAQCAALTHRYLMQPAIEGRQGPLSARTQLALRLHNACTAGAVLPLLATPEALEWAVDPRFFPREGVERIVLASALAPVGLRTRQIDDGIGVAAVAIGRSGDAAARFPAQPYALAINVRAEPRPAGGGVRFVVTDASRRTNTHSAFGPLPLARDPSAAYAVAATMFEHEVGRWAAFRGAQRTAVMPTVRLLAPVDPRKTPVLLVHGLASSPMTWADLVNELQGDPDIQANYQFWLLRYPTGLPMLVNRRDLAGAIDQFRARAFPGDNAPRRTVAIGHSMGGLLTRLLVTDSGQALWDAAFVLGPDQLEGAPRDIAEARSLFVFEPVRGIDEVVFIATPHRGSEKARGPVSRIVRGLIRGPGKTLSFLARLASDNARGVEPALRANYLAGGPSSLDTLDPHQPVFVAARELPVANGVRVHSLVGVRDARRPEHGDGVVPLSSAGWPEGDRQVIASGHAVHATPEAAAIVKQLLLDRLARDGLIPDRNQ